MRAHVIENEKIVNTIEVESLDMFPDMHLIDAAIGGKIGDNFIDGNVVPATAPIVIGSRKMTVLAFRNRFTAVEKAMIEFAAVHNPFVSTQQQMQAATVRAYLSDLNSAKYIDPDREDTRDSLLILEYWGLIKPGRAVEILDAPIHAHEMP